jgi:hypothetical protein
MTTSTRAKRAHRSKKSNVIYLAQRFPGRFQGPPTHVALMRSITAILETATPEPEQRS